MQVEIWCGARARRNCGCPSDLGPSRWTAPLSLLVACILRPPWNWDSSSSLPSSNHSCRWRWRDRFKQLYPQKRAHCLVCPTRYLSFPWGRSSMTWETLGFFNSQNVLVDTFYMLSTHLPTNHGGEKPLAKLQSALTDIAMLWLTRSSTNLLTCDKKYLNYILASGRAPLGKNLTQGV